MKSRLLRFMLRLIFTGLVWGAATVVRPVLTWEIKMFTTWQFWLALFLITASECPIEIVGAMKKK